MQYGIEAQVDALTRHFLRHQNTVVAVGQQLGNLAELQAEYPATLHPLACDLTQRSQLDALVHCLETEVNVTTGLAFAPKRSAPVYCGTKAELHVFTRALRYQLEGTAVKVFEIIPPVVDTPMTASCAQSKITSEALAAEFWRNFARDRWESNIGKVKLLRQLLRLAPATAARLLKPY